MVQKGPKGVRAKFADATAELVRAAGPEDPGPLFPRDGFDAGKWDGAPFDKLPPNCPVVPLGILGKLSFFLDTSGQIMSFDGMKPADMLRLFRLTPNFPYWAWPRWSAPKAEGDEKPKPRINGVEEKKAIQCLEKACAVRGLFDPRNRLRGRGAWTDRAGRLIWHSGDALWRVDGNKLVRSEPGEIDSIFYPRFAGIMSPWQAPVDPSDSPARTIFDMLQTWTWERPLLDPLIVLGGIGVMLIGGALHHRPHMAAMGDFGTGKSSLQDLVKGILGDTLMRSENATEAGVRQNMGIDALPVALDEFEARDDNRRAIALVELARVAYSGGEVTRGGQDHQGVKFIARNTFFCSGINMPPMEASDRSRFAILNLGKIKVGKTAPPAIQEEWGRMLLRALMDGWNDLNVIRADWRATLAEAGLSGRGQDTYGTLFSIAQLLLGAADMEELGIPITEQNRLGAMIAEATAEERAEQLENWRGAFEHLVASPVDLMHGGVRMSIGDTIENMFAEHGQAFEEKLANDAARMAGCKLIAEADDTLPHGQMRWFLTVPPKGPFIARIFETTKWKQGGWFAALKQAPPDIVIRDRGNKQVHKINGATQRCLLIDLKAYDDFTTKQRKEN
jgi:hypothetical protein